MTSTLSIANRRREILISMWVKDPFSVQTQVDTHDMALRVAHNISDEAEALTDTVGSHRPRSVFVLKAGSDPDRTWSVWVRAGFSNYKAAYLAFINEAYGVAMTGDDIPGYQVDHLSNKAYAPTGNEYIRVEAIPEAANHSWGRQFRKRPHQEHRRPVGPSDEFHELRKTRRPARAPRPGRHRRHTAARRLLRQDRHSQTRCRTRRPVDAASRLLESKRLTTSRAIPRRLLAWPLPAC